MSTWEYLGEAIRAPRLGIEYRPHVVWNARTQRFVMWCTPTEHQQSAVLLASSSTDTLSVVGPTDNVYNPTTPGVHNPKLPEFSYAVATSKSPAGPFKVVNDNVSRADLC